MGSNIYNVLLVLWPVGAHRARGHRIERWEGVVFIGSALAYTAYLVLDATGHRAIGPFSAVMLFFVIPLT